MSGGHFMYAQQHIYDIADILESDITAYKWKELDLTPETIEEFKKGLEIIRKAYVYAQRIDWLLSGDDGEESFHLRLKEDLDKLK